MGFAASSFSSLSSNFSGNVAQGARPWLAPLTHWLQKRAGQHKQATARPARPAPSPVHQGGQIVAPVVRPTAPPLRVLRVVDGSSRQCAGRMVISGRMADVCAELDRLAAREAQRAAEQAQRNDRRQSLN